MAYGEVTLNQNETDGQQIAVDQIGGIDFQRVKISVGVEGSATDVSSSAPMPVTASALPLPTGAATESTLSTLNGKVTACNTGAVVVSSSALPTDAATQTTLALIKAKTDNIDVALSTRTKPADQQHVIVDSQVAPTSIVNGKTTVSTAGTRVQLSSNTCLSITLKALSANTGTIYVGNSSVASTNGFELLAGDTVSLDISNTNVVYIDSSVNGEGVTWLAVN